MKRKNKMISTLFNPKGAGRPRGSKASYLPHIPRPELKRNTVIHITLKRSPFYGCLRTKNFLKLVKRAIYCARRKGLFISAFTIQSNHLHLCAETKNSEQLKRGMKAFTAAIIYYLGQQALLKKGISFFADRYHVAIKFSFAAIGNTLRYILTNTQKHTRQVHCSYTFKFPSGNLSPPAHFLLQKAFAFKETAP